MIIKHILKVNHSFYYFTICLIIARHLVSFRDSNGIKINVNLLAETKSYILDKF